jgi:hypothetical protein
MSRIAQEYYLPSPSIEPRQYHEAPLRFFPTSFRPIRQKNGKHSSSMENVEDDQRLGESETRQLRDTEYNRNRDA